MITTAIYYSVPSPHKSIKEALHGYDLTFAEIGIFVFAINANKPITIDDLLLFSPVESTARVQAYLSELVRLGFLVRHES